MASVGGPTLRMLTGKPIPVVGLGTWRVVAGQAEKAVGYAIDAGYRHIDTARGYGNEGEIGNALEAAYKDGKVKREDFYITTKLTGPAALPHRVRQQTELSLKQLKTDYVDLLLIHFPVTFPDTRLDEVPPVFFPADENGVRLAADNEPIDTWREMEKLVDDGLVRAIGLSNFNKSQVQTIWDNSRIKPSNLQCECHAWFPQNDLVSYCQEKGITFSAYGPIGSPGRPVQSEGAPVLMEDPVVVRIAQENDKTPAQVLLKYLLQLNLIVLPKSVSEHRIISNFQVFDFTLSEKDMADLKAINKEERLFPHTPCGPVVRAHPQWPW